MAELLLIRADASPEMGTGHVMRCLSLAEQWLACGGTARLLSASLPPALVQRAQTLGVAVETHPYPPGSTEDARETVMFAGAHGASWVAVDGYHFDACFQRTIKGADFKLLWLDDFGHLPEYSADCVLNQNLNVSPALYPNLSPATTLLAGCRYALLRREFLTWRAWRRTIPGHAVNLLVTLGGSDPDNVTLKVAEAIRRLGDSAPQTTIVTGASSPHGASHAAALRDGRHRLLRNATNMPELMAEADLAIAAGGTTTWELAFMGLPTLMLTLAENQVSNCEKMAVHGAAVNLGWPASISVEAMAEAIRKLAGDAAGRQRMAEQGRALVDGDGAFRVWLHLHAEALRLQQVTDAHCRLIYEWANAPEVRAVSFASEPIPWEQHVAWFQARLADPQNRFWLALDGTGTPVGQVRFALDDRAATISVSLAAEARGRNLGSLLIWTACRKLLQEQPAVAVVDAWIKPDNQASRRAFQKAGFLFAEQKLLHGQPAVRYEWRPL